MFSAGFEGRIRRDQSTKGGARKRKGGVRISRLEKEPRPAKDLKCKASGSGGERRFDSNYGRGRG